MKILLAEDFEFFHEALQKIHILAARSVALAVVVLGGLLLYQFLQGSKNARDKRG